MAKKKIKQKKRRRLKNVDSGFIRFISKSRKKKLTVIMKFITHLGDGWLWLGMIVGFLFVDINVGMALGFAMVIQIGFQLLLKNIFTRERPYIKHKDISNLMLPPDKFSFPSGHTAGAFAMAITFWYFYPVLFVPFLVLAVLIAASRMYLGLHYPSDVLAGIVLGYGSARLAVFLILLIDI